MRRPAAADVALAAFMALAIAAQTLFAPGRGQPVWANLVVGVVMGAIVAWRRIAPLGALIGVGVCAWILAAFLRRPQDLFSMFLVLSALAFSAGAIPDRHRARVGLALVVALIVGVDVLSGDMGLGDQIFPLALFGGWWGLGRATATRRRQTAELRARAEQLERERAENERGAVALERARIARELHDVVAHSLSVMVVQSGAARRVLDRDPDASIRALGAVEDTGREALAEMRRLLGILRPEGETAAHEPQPSLATVATLVDRAGAAGLEVELRTEGRPGALEPGVDLTAYRVVQEALTNALKHGGDGNARVTLRWSAELLEIEVANRIGDGPPAILAGAGQGLMGMRERVALCGGELRAGPVGRGFVVRARLPRERGAAALSPPAPAAA